MAKTITVATEGTWGVDNTGLVLFTPKSTFADTPTAIEYTVNSTSGETSERASIEVGYEKVLNAHVFVVGGQSNAVGTTDYTDNTDVVPDNVYQIAREISITQNRDQSLATIANHALDNNKKETTGAVPVDGRPNFQMEFIRRYIADNPGVPIVLIPCASGGSGFDTGWNVGEKYFNDLTERTDNALQNNPTWELKGILWHMFETDSWRTDFLGKLQPVFEAFRAKYSAPIILGEAVPQWVADNNREVGQRSMQQITGVVPNTYVTSANVPTVIPHNPSNKIHFNHAGLLELGKRYYEGFKQMQGREQGASFHALIGADNYPWADISNGTACEFENGVEHPLGYGKMPEVTTTDMPITPIQDTENITVCTVVKLKPDMITAGTKTAMGTAFRVYSNSSMALESHTGDGFASGGAIGDIAPAQNYTFVAYSMSADLKTEAYVGFPNPVQKSLVANGRAVNSRKIGCGNAYASSIANDQSEICEIIVFNEYKTQAELAEIHARSIARLANRGITVD